MKKLMALALAAALLSGCSAISQLEGQAFLVSMALDRTAEGGIRVSAKYPAYGAGEKEKTGGYLLSAAEGPGFAEALSLLNATVPREVNLRQLRTLIVSEALASSGDFPALLRELKFSWRVDGEAALLVSRGEAESVLAAQEPLIGLRLSDALTTSLEDGQRLGYIPAGSLSDVFYDSASVYRDPAAALVGVSGGASGEGRAGGLPRSGKNEDEYYGAALFREGVMVGTLTGGEAQLLALIRGGTGLMPMTLGDGALLAKRGGALRVAVDLTGPAPRLSVSFEVAVEDVRGAEDGEAAARLLAERLDALTARCQALGVDPFGYGAYAARRFATMADWLAFDWRARFREAEIVYRPRCRRVDV